MKKTRQVGNRVGAGALCAKNGNMCLARTGGA